MRHAVADLAAVSVDLADRKMIHIPARMSPGGGRRIDGRQVSGGSRSELLVV